MEDHRHYEPVGPVAVQSAKVRVKRGGIDLVIWVPETGILNAVEFVETVEARFEQFVRCLDRILDSSIPVIAEAIAEFWQISEPPPVASDLIRTGEFQQLNLNGGPGAHEVIIHDEGELIGGHDLLIQLDSQLWPVSASFDG